MLTNEIVINGKLLIVLILFRESKLKLVKREKRLSVNDKFWQLSVACLQSHLWVCLPVISSSRVPGTFFQNTAQLQYVEDSELVTRSTWPSVNSAKTEMQVQEEMDQRYSTSAPHGRGATSYTETVEYQDMVYWEIKSLKVSEEIAVTIVSGRIFQLRTVRG